MVDGTWSYPFWDVNSAVSNGNQIAQEFSACSTNSVGDYIQCKQKTKDNGYNLNGKWKWEMGNVERL